MREMFLRLYLTVSSTCIREKRYTGKLTNSVNSTTSYDTLVRFKWERFLGARELGLCIHKEYNKFFSACHTVSSK